MAQRSLFFNSENHDRVYDATDFARVFSRYFTNGVFNNGLQVKANNNMTVSVSIGSGNINGYLYDNDEDLVLDIEVSDSSQGRVDSIILRLDLINRQITAQVLKGAFSTSPTKPTLTRSTSIYDLRLADVLVSAGSNRITTENITDTRFGNECGNVTATVQQLNTEGVFTQYQAMFDDLIGNMRDLIDKDAAGHLLNQIEQLENKLKNSSYQVGDLFLTTNNKNPGDRFGGNWNLIAKGRTLVGVDEDDPDFETVEKEIGDKIKTTNSVLAPAAVAGANGSARYVFATEAWRHSHTVDVVQPSFTCFIWQKIAD